LRDRLAVASVTVDAYGRVTAAANVAIAIDGAQIVSGTISDARLSANVALLNANQTFTGAQTFAGDVTLNGKVRDATGSPGTNGFFLQSTGANVKWVSALGPTGPTGPTGATGA